MCKKAANVFEQVVEVSDRVKIKSVMRNHNTKLAMMTGSGAAVFGVFVSKQDAENCKKALEDMFSSVFIAEPTEKALYICE